MDRNLLASSPTIRSCATGSTHTTNYSVGLYTTKAYKHTNNHKLKKSCPLFYTLDWIWWRETDLYFNITDFGCRSDDGSAHKRGEDMGGKVWASIATLYKLWCKVITETRGWVFCKCNSYKTHAKSKMYVKVRWWFAWVKGYDFSEYFVLWVKLTQIQTHTDSPQSRCRRRPLYDLLNLSSSLLQLLDASLSGTTIYGKMAELCAQSPINFYACSVCDYILMNTCCVVTHVVYFNEHGCWW